jgi:integrase
MSMRRGSVTPRDYRTATPRAPHLGHTNLRRIKVHHLRHTTATLLKNLGVPARDAQLIVGHSRLAVTLEIYTHEDRQAQREALGRISDALGHSSGTGSE